MRILYLHGRLSSPSSEKARRLTEMGHDVVAPELPKDDWTQSLRNAEKAILEHNPSAIVASSRGAAVAMAANSNLPAVLIAPAWKKFNPRGYMSRNTIVIHSQKDEVVPYIDSLWITKLRGIPLIDAGHDHRMNSEDVMAEIAKALRSFDEGG